MVTIHDDVHDTTYEVDDGLLALFRFQARDLSIIKTILITNTVMVLLLLLLFCIYLVKGV